MLRVDLKKYTIKYGKFEKEATLTLLVNLMKDADELQDLVRYGIDPAKYLPGMTTTKSKELQNVLLTDSLFQIGLDDEDAEVGLPAEGLDRRPPAHVFEEIVFKVKVKLEGKGTDKDPQQPILKLEFAAICTEELSTWLFLNLEKTVGIWFKLIEDTQGTIAKLVTDERTGDVVDTRTGEVVS